MDLNKQMEQIKEITKNKELVNVLEKYSDASMLTQQDSVLIMQSCIDFLIKELGYEYNQLEINAFYWKLKSIDFSASNLGQDVRRIAKTILKYYKGIEV